MDVVKLLQAEDLSRGRRTGMIFLAEGTIIAQGIFPDHNIEPRTTRGIGRKGTRIISGQQTKLCPNLIWMNIQYLTESSRDFKWTLMVKCFFFIYYFSCIGINLLFSPFNWLFNIVSNKSIVLVPIYVF